MILIQTRTHLFIANWNLMANHLFLQRVWCKESLTLWSNLCRDITWAQLNITMKRWKDDKNLKRRRYYFRYFVSSCFTTCGCILYINFFALANSLQHRTGKTVDIIKSWLWNVHYASLLRWPYTVTDSINNLKY